MKKNINFPLSKDIPCVIFAGGYGSRMGALVEEIPKPLLEIGDRPILFWLIEYYLAYNVNTFYILAGYRQEKIKLALQSYLYEQNDIEIKFNNKGSSIEFLRKGVKLEFSVKIIDTGKDSLTALRLKKVLANIVEERFFLTYGDGLANVNLHELIVSHMQSNKEITITTTDAPERFGVIAYGGDGRIRFDEKKPTTSINAGFMLVEKRGVDYLLESDDNFNEPFETSVLVDAAKKDQLNTYYHKGFWRCMDTPADQKFLDEICKKTLKPWMEIK
jgi:glucose-1-phosphate cytidylyltransferase